MITSSPTHPETGPISPATIAISLFIAADIMFFTGLLGSYIVLRSSQPDLFTQYSHSLNKTPALLNTAILILSAISMAMAVNATKTKNGRKQFACLTITLILASAFLTIEAADYAEKYNHHSIVATDPVDHRTYLYEGHEQTQTDSTITLQAVRKELLPNDPFDLHQITPSDLTDIPSHTYQIDPDRISQDLCYGPAKNIFYAFFFTLTAAHAVHLFAGAIVLATALLTPRPGNLQNIAVFWYYLTAIWLLLLSLLYLV